MALPNSGQPLTGAYVYAVELNATVGGVAGVTAADLLTPRNAGAGTTVTFGTDSTTGSETITYTTQTGTVVTQDISTTGDAQTPTAFTYTSGGNTYIVSNGPIAPPIADTTVGDETVLVGGLGDLGLTYGAATYVACYLAGTHILTANGNVPVETLSIGDQVVTASGSLRPIKWVGHRSYAARFVAANASLQPVKFTAGSLGGDLPRRDLLVSPAHAMFLDGILVPASCLVNGSTIVQERGVGRVDYFHVELDSHDVLLAEGAPSESFIDDDSRCIFHNAAEYASLYPGALKLSQSCAPKVESGFHLEAIRGRLAHASEETVLAA